MPATTRNQIRQQALEPISAQEFERFKEELNSAVIKGLRSVTQRVTYSAKVQISRELFQFLQRKYSLAFRAKECDDFLDDFRVLRGNFKNKTDFSKVDSFKVALRNSRKVMYQSVSDGKLQKHYLSPLPYVFITFFRDDLVLSLLR